MAQRVASIFAEIGLDSSKLSSGAKEAGSSIDKLVNDLLKIPQKDNEVIASFNKTETEIVKLGGDFSKLDGQVSQMIKQMEAATPENLEYAKSVARIQEEYNKGNISSQEAAKQLKFMQDSFGPAKESSSKFGDELKKLSGISLSTAGALAFAAKAGTEIVKFLREAEQAAVESAKADAVVEAVLKSTGYAAGISAQQVDDYAEALSKSAGVDDEAVKSASAVMLTFTQIGEEVFPRAMQAAADMAAVLGGDLNGKVTMIGKAMNDFTGYAALKRAGVSFTEEQLKQIKNFKETNDLIGYQKLVMAELEREYGGAAEAVNKAGDGTENLKIASGNLKEAIGGSLVPEVRKWNEGWTRFYDNLTRVTEAGTQQRKAMQELGITFMGSVYYQNGAGITREQAQAAIEAQIALDSEAESLVKVAASAQLSEEQLAEMNRVNKEAIGLVASFTSEERNFTRNMEGLQDAVNDSQKNLEYWTDVVARAPKMVEDLTETVKGFEDAGDTSSRAYKEAKDKLEDWENTLEHGEGYLTTLNKKLDDNKQAIEDAAEAHSLATRKIILGYLEQQLSLDGLDDQETDFLLAQGVAWGIYSETAVAEMQEVRDAWHDWVPENKDATFTITTKTINLYLAQGNNAQNLDEALLGVDLNGNGHIGYANGGDFIVPPGYPNDSYGIRVQSGEHVQVTPANEVGSGGMSESMIERMAGVFAVKMAAALQKTLPGIS